MGKVCHIFKYSIHWGLGNGNYVSFWFDKWNSSGAIRAQIYGPLQKGEEQLTVSQVWKNNVCDFSSHSFTLPVDLQNSCESVHIPNQCYNPQDFMISNLSSKGNFDFSAARKSFKPPELAVNECDIGWIWKIQTLPKIQFFVWLVSLNRLPHKFLLGTSIV